MKKSKGFTLVELMVVIVIIGILAALAIPRFMQATNKSKATEFKPILKQIYTLQEAYKQEHDKYGKLTEIGFDQPSSAARFTYTSTAPDVPTAGTNVALANAAVNSLGAKIKGIKADGTEALLTAGKDDACINDQGVTLAQSATIGTLASIEVASAFTTCTAPAAAAAPAAPNP